MKTLAMRILERQGVSYQMFRYDVSDEDFDAGRIARDNGLAPELLFKTLFCTDGLNGLLAALVPSDNQLSLKKLAAISQCPTVRLLETAMLQAKTGYLRGGCSPLGAKKACRVYIQETSAINIWINAGRKGMLLLVPVEAILRLTDGVVGDIRR